MKKHFHHYLILLFSTMLFSPNHPCLGQAVDFKTSNLPILIIDTEGQEILDNPKITAFMGIINNGVGKINTVTDPFNEYDGFIGIELRGNSSQTWAKKPYGIETRDSLGENNNVSIFGMPPENDWVLHAPYVDKSLMRNVLMYQLLGEMGRYAPRTQFCELVLNGKYMGVFVFIEKIKRDANRVKLSKPNEDNISGGYLLEMVVNNETDDEPHFQLQQSKKKIAIKYPKSDKLTTEQQDWIASYVNDFETALNSETFDDSATGYMQYIDLPSFIDHILISEGFNQLDAYAKSQYFYKKKNGKLFSGPGWDYNRCMGNAKFFNSWSPTVWWLKEPLTNNPEGWYRINWPARMMEDPEFMDAYCARWFELRQTTLSFEHLFGLIDNWAELLEEARLRNFERWPVLGVSISNKFAFDTYEEEIDYIKIWITEKFTWLDEQFNLPENYALDNLLDYSRQEFIDPATNVVDGNEFSRWSAQNFPQWIEIDLGEIKPIYKTVIKPFLSRAYQFKIEAKADWWDEYTTIVDRLDNTEGSLEIANSFDLIKARYLKLTVTGAASYDGNLISIFEFKVFDQTTSCFDSTTAIREIEKTISASVFPNPFTHSTTISFKTLEAGKVKIVIYDLMGKEATILTDSWHNAGQHEVKFDGSQLSNGAYVFKIWTGKYIQTGKIIHFK